MDPNNPGNQILCSATPTQDGMAKVLVTSEGVTGTVDNPIPATVWATTNVVFDYRAPLLAIREVSVNGDPTERDLYIGENALVRVATHDPNFWPLVYGSTITFSANAGMIYPDVITIGCPGDTSYAVSFFNNLTANDDDVATPILITVDTREGDAYTFTETLYLHASTGDTLLLGDSFENFER
jgi:hypothetical protein